jgi:uncharacterized membrane protein
MTDRRYARVVASAGVIQQRPCDGRVHDVSRLTRRRSDAGRMESRVKLLGHAVHPMLIVLPLGLLNIAVLFDVVYLLTGNADFAFVAYWNIAIGVLGGLAAAVFGVIDWLALPRETRAKRIGQWHGAGNSLMIGLFAVSWLLRGPDTVYAPDLVPFVLAALGAGLSLLTAWLGGELVYRLRVGVDDDAQLNASNSIARDGVISVGGGDTGAARTAGPTT